MTERHDDRAPRPGERSSGSEEENGTMTEKTTTIEREVVDDDRVSAPLWKNRIFLKSGRSVMGAHTFLTREDAHRAAQEGEAKLRVWLMVYPDVLVTKRGGPVLYRATEYSHCVQEPWG